MRSLEQNEVKISIVSYNVNGIRAALGKGLAAWIAAENPEIVCFQEIKADESQIDVSIFSEMGYNGYWFPASKKGYSGVGVISKLKPLNVINGMSLEKYDSEGRTLILNFEHFMLVNSYFPSGTTGDTRQDFKMEYLADFLCFIEELKKTRKEIIVSGDFNICHKPIDINFPQKHLKSSGFLPEEREWMDKFIENGFVDTFREFNNEPEQYSWWSYRANSRAKNLGWRIDYHMVSIPLKKNLTGASILKDVFHSDHCPVKVEFIF